MSRLRNISLSLSCVSALACAGVSGSPAAAGPITVSFQAQPGGGLIAHEAIRVSSDTVTNEIGYNDKPILAPFRSPDGAGGRFSVHPDAATVGVDFNYMALDGAGVFNFVQSGTTLINGFAFPIGEGTFGTPGDGLPLAAHTALLSEELALPNGVTLASGTTLYADLAGFRADFNDPASYWYDEATGVEHRTYTGGTWAFFYEDPAAAGSFLKLAEYRDVVFAWEINLRAGTLTNTWAGTPEAVEGLRLPAQVSGHGLTSPLSTVGVFSNELDSPLTGFYGQFLDAYTVTFDVDGAELVSAIPEPSSVALLATGLLSLLGIRRRSALQTRRSAARHV
ncbi:MAG TPA: PEP-CTERM sorting domain-containing protein [Planctomycetaceae bacterium]|nr:PEP-CTERM sorting domain-containing protein [Planctomycetaceae bacterium]